MKKLSIFAMLVIGMITVAQANSTGTETDKVGVQIAVTLMIISVVSLALSVIALINSFRSIRTIKRLREKENS